MIKINKTQGIYFLGTLIISSLMLTPLAMAGVTCNQSSVQSQAESKAYVVAAADDDACFRKAQYLPLLDPDILGKQLAIGNGYSHYQGVTGMLLRQGKNRLLVEGLAPEFKAAIIIPQWLRKPLDEKEPTKDPRGWGLYKRVYPITEGINTLDIEEEGLAYVSYYMEDPSKASPITITFIDGEVNGYFDITKHDNKDWDRLLAQAKYPIMDAVGRHIQVGYPVVDLQKFAAGRGVDLINNYDKMMQNQYDLMGLTKYKRIPNNKILARVNYNYYMFRDGDGVAYMGGPQGYAMAMVANPDSVIKDDPCWGFNHEVGHAHQLRPEFNWAGLGEVSNNIFSLYGTIALGNSSRLKEGSIYDKARKDIIEAGISYLQTEDVFQRLVPFWQLQLYFVRQGHADFYPDLFEAMRCQHAQGHKMTQLERGSDPAYYQLNFVKLACQVGQTDLTEFFEQYGFFVLGEWTIQDYGDYHYKMTAEMVKACKEEITAMKLPKPTLDPSRCED